MKREEYIALVDRCKQLSYEYYVLAQPTVSDAQFDALVSEIERTEAEHPEWTLADSPTQTVGSDVDPKSGRRLIRHRTRMLSCQKAQTTDAVTKWMNSTEKKLKGKRIEYALEWKLDGVSCSLVYLNGRLVSAASRGNKGVMGQDWLQHVGRIPSVPQSIAAQGRVEVRGEIVCPKAELARLGYKDCRTAAASLMNQVWPSDDCKRLVFVAWQMDDDTDATRSECLSMNRAQSYGFNTCMHCITGTRDVIAVLEEADTEREALPYPTDGVVVKIDDKAMASSLGYTEHHPKGSIAYKFCAQKAVTRVINIEVKVGETGRRTPVAYLEPVTILGREVSSASLGSERVAAELGVVVGCMVEVGLSNDVKPKIYRVVDGGHTEITESSDFVAQLAESSGTGSADAESVATDQVPVPCDSAEQNDAPGYSASEKSQTPTPSATEPDLFAQMQQELDTLRAENERLRAASAVSVSATEANHRGQSPCNPLGEAVATHTGDSPHDSPTVSQPRPRRVRRQKQDVMSLYSSPAITVDHSEDDHSERNRKIFAAVATAVVFVVLVNTVGLFGIAAIGLLAGGLVK